MSDSRWMSLVTGMRQRRGVCGPWACQHSRRPRPFVPWARGRHRRAQRELDAQVKGRLGLRTSPHGGHFGCLADDRRPGGGHIVKCTVILYVLSLMRAQRRRRRIRFMHRKITSNNRWRQWVAGAASHDGTPHCRGLPQVARFIAHISKVRRLHTCCTDATQ